MKKIAEFVNGRFVIFESDKKFIFYDLYCGFRRSYSKLDLGFSGIGAEGFISSNYSPEVKKIILNWQRPVITELDAYHRHADLDILSDNKGCINIYIGLPWASYVDGGCIDFNDVAWVKQLINGLHQLVLLFNKQLRVHTVCQHINWNILLDVWKGLSITDVWLPHVGEDLECIKTHPWPLYAVNYEDDTRAADLSCLDINERDIVASFVGAHSDSYLSASRLYIYERLSSLDGFYIKLNRNWHFEIDVYGFKYNENSCIEFDLGDSIKYNNVLSRSKFSLIPVGAGVNTIRLWESMAVGAVPVFIGFDLYRPFQERFNFINWRSCSLFVDVTDIERIPNLLSCVSDAEWLSMSNFARVAYNESRLYKCF